MIVPRDGGYVKLTCPECKKDTLVESGMGGTTLYCSGRCMDYFDPKDCPAKPVEKEEAELTLQRAG